MWSSKLKLVGTNSIFLLFFSIFQCSSQTKCTLGWLGVAICLGVPLEASCVGIEGNEITRGKVEHSACPAIKCCGDWRLLFLSSMGFCAICCRLGLCPLDWRGKILLGAMDVAKA